MFHGLLKDSLLVGTYKHTKYHAKKSAHKGRPRKGKQSEMADLMQAYAILKNIKK
jgi:hypothetical protein